MPTAAPSRRFIIVDDSTIREARDRQEEKRPRKRARVVDSDDEDAPKKYERLEYEQKGPYERDPKFFKEDPSATCVVRVRDYMFKIHADLLSCCQIMSECLQDHVERYGMPTEERPFQCPYPTVEEYRAFLWALYATVEQLSEIAHDHADLERLSQIIKLNRKYDIPKMLDWVTDTVHRTATNAVFMESCSSASLTLLVEIAKENKYTKTLDAVVRKWCDRILNKSTPSVPAIQIADKYELQELGGVAYYVHVQDMLDRQTGFTEKGATQLRADPKLNNGQVMRLLTGYWSLVSLWERLRLKPIELPMAASCSAEAHVKCAATWERRCISAAGWKRILGINSADILALLACLRDQLSNDDDLKAATNPECRLAGLEALKALRTKTQAGLADHFFACV
ncbi:hypothetical protein BDZ97DRAFT_1702033 [Flammula alnicola]|nr:hypothetical protein BDZ97DRAFT_1702033 [Flammula alnicola]